MEEIKLNSSDVHMFHVLEQVALYFASRGIRINAEAYTWRLDGHRVLIESADNLDGLIDAPASAELDKWGYKCWEDGCISYRIKAKEVA